GGAGELGRRRRDEVALSRPSQRAGRMGGAERLAVGPVRPAWRLAAVAMSRSRRRVPRPECGRRIDPAGHGTRWLLGRRPSPPGAIAVRLTGLARTADPELLVGLVDLGHPPRRVPGSLRVARREVRMMLAGEAAPGGLDRRLGSPPVDAEDGVRV